jgi:hypothetical protein
MQQAQRLSTRTGWSSSTVWCCRRHRSRFPCRGGCRRWVRGSTFRAATQARRHPYQGQRLLRVFWRYFLLPSCHGPFTETTSGVLRLLRLSLGWLIALWCAVVMTNAGERPADLGSRRLPRGGAEHRGSQGDLVRCQGTVLIAYGYRIVCGTH